MHEDTLASVELFSGLDKKELHHIANSCQERKYTAGTALMKQGSTGAGLFVITAGHVKITKETDPDHAEVEVATAGPGEVLGEMALLDDLPRSANVIATEDVTALLLPIWDFRAALRGNPDIALKLLAALTHRLRAVEARDHV
ncbi:MAG TPA: cyclic nucleotide-binding domain-containing protein [Ktedonobacteraceae bacterium]